ncbi:MAG: choice-of-anchor Q domain-containing protein, partial [Gemmataceae bacterium]
LNLTFCTLAGNTVNSAGGAVYNLAYGNTIVANGSTPAGSAQTATAAITDSILSNTSGGVDLVNNSVNGKNTNTATVTLVDNNVVQTSSGAIGGTTALTGDPGLAALASNGGPTRTMAIPASNSSSAYQAGTSVSGVTTDQRGYTRPTAKPSLGAFDPQATAAVAPTISVTDASGVYNGNPFSASATAVGTDGKTPVNGNFTFTYYIGTDTSGTSLGSTAPVNAGTYTVVATFTSTDSNYTSGGTAQTTFTISPAPLSASGINISATAGAPFSGALATFTNADPVGNAASYTAVINWGDGGSSIGVISGSGNTLTVSGSHTYATKGKETIQVTIGHKLGDTTTATIEDAANVRSLGQSVHRGQTATIDFWDSSMGQALLDSFNAGLSSTALSAWLATSFPNLFGAGAGANNLTGNTNAEVAAFFQSQFALTGAQVEAEVLATALNIYATTLSLGGTAGQVYGFKVSTVGLGAASVNVGGDGAAFGVAKRTTLNVYQLLLAVNQQTVNGVLYNGNSLLQQQAVQVFDTLNNRGQRFVSHGF